MFYLNHFSKVDLNTFFAKFPVRFDKIFKYFWETLQHVCKKCPTFENSNRFRNVYYMFCQLQMVHRVLFRALYTWQSRTWHKEQLVTLVGGVGVRLVCACTECFTLLKLGAAGVWTLVVLHVIISFQIALVLQNIYKFNLRIKVTNISEQ